MHLRSVGLSPTLACVLLQRIASVADRGRRGELLAQWEANSLFCMRRDASKALCSHKLVIGTAGCLQAAHAGHAAVVCIRTVNASVRPVLVQSRDRGHGTQSV